MSALTDSSGDKTFTIGQLAEEFGLTLRSIRFYEAEGLLAPSRDGQCRLFTKQDRARLKLICRGKRLGFSVAEIKEFLNLYTVDRSQHEQMRFLLDHARARIAALKTQLDDVKQTLAELQQIEGEIVAHLKSGKESHS
jgi:DNA-binding transcriptional MerR regulator